MRLLAKHLKNEASRKLQACVQYSLKKTAWRRSRVNITAKICYGDADLPLDRRPCEQARLMGKSLDEPINFGNKALDVIIVIVREYGRCTFTKKRVDVIVERLKKAAAAHDHEVWETCC